MVEDKGGPSAWDAVPSISLDASPTALRGRGTVEAVFLADSEDSDSDDHSNSSLVSVDDDPEENLLRRDTTKAPPLVRSTEVGFLQDYSRRICNTGATPPTYVR